MLCLLNVPRSNLSTLYAPRIRCLLTKHTVIYLIIPFSIAASSSRFSLFLILQAHTHSRVAPELFGHRHMCVRALYDDGTLICGSILSAPPRVLKTPNRTRPIVVVGNDHDAVVLPYIIYKDRAETKHRSLSVAAINIYIYLYSRTSACPAHSWLVSTQVCNVHSGFCLGRNTCSSSMFGSVRRYKVLFECVFACLQCVTFSDMAHM